MAKPYKLPKSTPATGAFAITPDDATDLADHADAIYVGGAGNLKVDMLLGGTVTFTALSVGVVHPLSVRRVYATGTTATSILGLTQAQ
jgi:hypothetical protein